VQRVDQRPTVARHPRVLQATDRGQARVRVHSVHQNCRSIHSGTVQWVFHRLYWFESYWWCFTFSIILEFVYVFDTSFVFSVVGFVFLTLSFRCT
jgi:hypothetical protein